MKLYRVMYINKVDKKRWVKFIDSNDVNKLMGDIKLIGELVLVQEIDESDGKPVRVIFKNENFKPGERS